MRSIKILFSFLGLLLAFGNLQAQSNQPFYDEIQAFRQQDSLHQPVHNGIVFTGSSSIRMWKNLQESFPGYPVLNRGFGGSTLPDLDLYLQDLVFKYHPKQVVIYSGENDIATDTVDAKMVFQRFRSVYDKIRKQLPNVPLVYISIKPSPSRRKFFPVMIEANRLIKSFLETQRQARFVDVFSLMLDAGGEPMKDIFLEDNLHMNSKGYAIWEKALKPELVK